MKIAKIILTGCLSISSSAFSEVVHYYDCIDKHGEKVYKIRPCSKGETKVRDFEHDLSEFDPKNKSSIGSTSDRELVLYAERDGHYYATGSINSHPIKFIVDTGATNVSLSSQTATGYGISGCSAGKAVTANGTVDVCYTTIANMKIGDFNLQNIPAVVMPNSSPALLGMSVISQFKVEQKNGVMRLSK